MSRITGREVFELMEAYRSIYEGYDEKKEKKGKKKVMHDCSTHCEHSEWGKGVMIEEMHTLDEEGNVSHYDIQFEHGIEKNVPVEDLTILEGKMHEHYVNDEKNAEVLDEKMDVFSAIGNTPSPVFTKPQQPRKGMGGAVDRAVADASKAAALKFFTKGMQPAGGRPATPGTPARPAAPARPGAPAPAASAPRPAGQTVAAAGGKGGTVTVGTKYAATLGGQKGSVSYDAAGKKTFTADKPAAAKPAPSAAPRPGTQASGPESIKPKTPNPLMQKTFGYQTGNAPDQIAKASAGAPPTPSGSALGAAAKPEVRKALNLPAKPSAAPEVKQTAEIAKKPVQPAVAPTSTQMRQGTFREEVDAYDLVLEYLLANGHADTVDEAHYVMLEMDSKTIRSIAEAQGEWFRGVFNPKNSVAARAQNTSPFATQPKPLPSGTSPFAKPASRGDSGRLTTYGAGGGAAAERSGQTRAQVMQQGAKNLENKKPKPVNQGPDFGR